MKTPPDGCPLSEINKKDPDPEITYDYIMAKYTSGNINLNGSAEAVFNKLSNLQNLRDLLDKVPADKVPDNQRAMLENLEITSDSIVIPGGPMGALTLKMVEKIEPELIKLNGEGLPMALSLAMHIKPESETKSSANVEIEIDIPAMLKPLIGGQIQKMASQFGDMLGAISFS